MGGGRTFLMTRIVAIFVVALAAALAAWFGARLAAQRGRATVAACAVVAALVYALFLNLKPGNLVLTNACVLIVAVLVGSGLGLLLTTKPALVSFCVVAGVADILSATGGLTRTLSSAYRDGTSDLLLLLSVSIRFDGRPQQVIGIGDLVVLAALFFALSRLGDRGLGALLAPLAGLAVALVAGVVFGGVAAIPFIAGATLGDLAFARADPSGSA